MALPPGTIVVANPGPHIGLFAVDPATGQQTTLAQGDLLVEPVNVVVMTDGRLLVADHAAFGTGGLIAVDPATGQQTKASSSELFLKPYGLALAADGQVVVVYVDRPHPFPAAVMRVNPANGTTGPSRSTSRSTCRGPLRSTRSATPS
jgi:outer membrane protein assembly factor BamB